MNPATPLPWHVEYVIARPQIAPEVASLMLNRECDENARYIAHACNAYPRLIEALRETAKRCDPSPAADRARALLRELGE